MVEAVTLATLRPPVAACFSNARVLCLPWPTLPTVLQDELIAQLAMNRERNDTLRLAGPGGQGEASSSRPLTGGPVAEDMWKGGGIVCVWCVACVWRVCECVWGEGRGGEGLPASLMRGLSPVCSHTSGDHFVICFASHA